MKTITAPAAITPIVIFCLLSILLQSSFIWFRIFCKPSGILFSHCYFSASDRFFLFFLCIMSRKKYKLFLGERTIFFWKKRKRVLNVCVDVLSRIKLSNTITYCNYYQNPDQATLDGALSRPVIYLGFVRSRNVRTAPSASVFVRLSANLALSAAIISVCASTESGS